MRNVHFGDRVLALFFLLCFVLSHNISYILDKKKSNGRRPLYVVLLFIYGSGIGVKIDDDSQ